MLYEFKLDIYCYLSDIEKGESMRKLILCFILIVLTSAGLFAQANKKVIIRNETGYTINDLFFSPSAFDDWEDDFLGEEPLLDGREIEITLNRDFDANEVIYDLQAVDEDNDYYTMYEVDISEDNIITITMDAYDGGDYADDEYDYSGYENGYNEGYSEGYKQGYIEAFRDAYLEGFKAGQATDLPAVPERMENNNSSNNWR